MKMQLRVHGENLMHITVENAWCCLCNTYLPEGTTYMYIRSWGPPSLLHNGYQVFPGGKATGAWRLPPTLSSPEIKEGVELYIYSPSGPSLPFTLHVHSLSQ